jgi:hypothetical protein
MHAADDAVPQERGPLNNDCRFPDVRIEYDIDGRDHSLDVEVMTPHYRGAHAAAKSGSGFRLHFSARSGGGRSSGRTPSIIEELLR